VVFGCGGDRDKGKRPLMGKIAERDADCAIVTSDNPRTEDPDAIIDDIEAGMRSSKHERVTDRLSAIRRAIELAEDADIVLVVTTGSERCQRTGEAADLGLVLSTTAQAGCPTNEQFEPHEVERYSHDLVRYGQAEVDAAA